MGLVIDASKLNAAFAAWASGTKLEAKKEMRTQARVLAMRLMENTQPSPKIRKKTVQLNFKTKKSFNDRLQQAAESRVASDINKVYSTIEAAASKIKFAMLPPGKTATQNKEQAARALVGLIKGKNYKRKTAAIVQAEKLLERLRVQPLIGTKIGNFDGGSAHQKARFGPRQRVPRNQYVKTIVLDPANLEKYTNERMGRAGVVKAAWAECAEKLGGAQDVRSGGMNAVPLPPWVKRHIGRYGKGQVKETLETDKPSIEMTNRVSYVKENISDQTIAETVSAQVLRLINRLLIIAKYEAKKAGL